MPKFSDRSIKELSTAHPDLQRLFNKVIEGYDCTVIQGQRSQEEHERNLEAGTSKTQNSKHVMSPAMAVDVAPYPVDWKNTKKFYHFAGYVQRVAEELGLKIRWGGDWDSDGDLNDQNFNDLPHFELRS